MLRGALLALLVATAVVSADRVLVLVDNLGTRETHSIFFKSLQERGHHLSVRVADDTTLSVFKYGELSYEHVIIFAPSVEEFGGALSVNELTKFVDAGGNLLVAASSNVGEAVRELAAEFGFEFDDAGTSVIDHHHFDSYLDDGYHTTVVAEKQQLMNAALITGDAASFNPVLFKGVALVAAKSNRLQLPVLRAYTTSYSYNPTTAVDEYPGAIGRQALLIGAMQARNNARVVFTGSLDMFSDYFINSQVHPSGAESKAVGSGNLGLITALSQWVLKENGVLRVKNVEHHLQGHKEQATEYTITDDVEYVIEVEELKNGKWQPFQGKDVQLEFVRMDPFVRTTLVNKNGKLVAKFKVPDVYGVFKFMVDYRRKGYTHLFDVQQVSVRPLLHTQYERFIRSAYPYYASSFSMMIGVVLFSMVYLHHKEPTKVVESKKHK